MDTKAKKIVNYSSRILKMLFGLFLCALGSVVTMRANLGFTPWNCFHQGLSSVFGITIGMANTFVGMGILCVDLIFRERIGLGTICNMFLIGVFTDFVINLNVIPVMQDWRAGILLMLVGMIIVAFGTCFYIKSRFGAGPRDSLMVAVTRKTRAPVGICRIAIEATVTFIGWLLGGPVGMGTLIGAFGQGACIQAVFKMMHFKPTEIHHEDFAELWKNLTAK